MRTAFHTAAFLLGLSGFLQIENPQMLASIQGDASWGSKSIFFISSKFLTGVS
jgi:hypothetical protein